MMPAINVYSLSDSNRRIMILEQWEPNLVGLNTKERAIAKQRISVTVLMEEAPT